MTGSAHDSPHRGVRPIEAIRYRSRIVSGSGSPGPAVAPGGDTGQMADPSRAARIRWRGRPHRCRRAPSPRRGSWAAASTSRVRSADPRTATTACGISPGRGPGRAGAARGRRGHRRCRGGCAGPAPRETHLEVILELHEGETPGRRPPMRRSRRATRSRSSPRHPPPVASPPRRQRDGHAGQLRQPCGGRTLVGREQVGAQQRHVHRAAMTRERFETGRDRGGLEPVGTPSAWRSCYQSLRYT